MQFKSCETDLDRNTTTPDLPFRFYSSGSQSLIVWFGGLHEPFISENLSLATGFDCLSIRDDRVRWYTDGLFDPHTSSADGIAFLRSFIAEGKYNSVIMCGQSSGAYAALFYGWHCAANLCIAFSPQTANHFDGQCQMTPYVAIEDLGRLYKPDGTVPIIVSASLDEADHENEFRWDDWRHIARLRNYPLCTVVTHPFHSHNVTARLKQAKQLYRFVKGMIEIYARN